METKSETISSSKSSPINIDVLLKKLNESTPYIETARQKEVVLVLGQTGSGKSTTVNYLLGTRMEEKEDDRGNFIVETARGEKIYAPIGHTPTSCTLYPTVYAKPNSALGFGDCPGFGDTRGREEQITVSVNIESTVKKAKCIKAIMVVVSREELTAGRGEVFKGISSMLGKLIRSPQSVKDSISFIITKPDTRRTTHKAILNTVEDIANAAKNQITTLGERYKGSKDKPKEVQDEEDKLSILALITEKNLFVIDVLEESRNLDRRDKILDFIGKANAIPIQQFRFNAFDEGRNHLNRLIFNIVKEGNALFEQVNQLPIEINNNKNEIENAKQINETYTTQIGNIKSGKKLMEAEKEKTRKAYNESIKANKTQVQDYEKQIAGKKEEKQTKKKEREIYDSNELVTYRRLEIYRPATTEGYVLSIFTLGLWPDLRVDRLNYSGLPFEQVEKIIHSGGYLTGATTWINEIEERNNGEYSVGFMGRPGVTDHAVVNIKLKKKNVPENAEYIKTLKSDIKVLKTSINELKQSILDLERKNEGIQEAIIKFEKQSVMDEYQKEEQIKNFQKEIELNKVKCDRKEKEIILKTKELQTTKENIKTKMLEFEMVEKMRILDLAVPSIDKFFNQLSQYRKQLTLANKEITAPVSSNPSPFFKPSSLVNTRNEKVETRNVEQKFMLPQ